MPGAENQSVYVMGIPPGEARLLELLCRFLAAQKDQPLKALDIGTFTGHSAGAIARGMTNGGVVITCDLEPTGPIAEYYRIATTYWEMEGVADRITAVHGPARLTVDRLTHTEAGTFDFAFIDADKANYDHYYEKALELLRPGGVIVLDNMLWSGKVGNPDDHDESTEALRSLNERIAADKRVRYFLLDAEDGIMIVEKSSS